MLHSSKLFLAAPLGLLLAAGTAAAQHGGHGGGHAGGHAGGVHMGGAHMGGVHPGVGMARPGGFPAYHPAPYYGAVRPIGYPGTYYGAVRPIGYGGIGYGSPFLGGLGYGLGGFGLGYGLGGYGLGLGRGGYGGLGYGYGGLGYGYGGYGGYGSSYLYSTPAYSAVLGVPATTPVTPVYDPNYADPNVGPATPAPANPAPAAPANPAPAAPAATGPAGPATVNFVFPAGAQIWFNGKEQPAGTTSFTSDVIQPGYTQVLDVRAKWDGSTRQMTLPLRAGDRMTVDMTK